MHPTIDSSIAVLRSTRHHPQIEILNRHRARIRSMFFIVAFATVVATIVIYVAQRRFNGAGESENEFSASAIVSKSVVRENNTLSLQVHTFSLPTDASIDDIQMINAKDGWVWGHGTELFKTSDGGENWTRVQLNLPARSYITDAYFLNQDAGWISVSRTEHDPDEAKGIYNATWIFETGDGGKTLTERSTIKHGQIREIEFVDGREGWATGRMLSRGYPERNANLVLHTTTGGQDWENLSAKLPPDRGVEGLHLIGPRAAAILTSDGSVNKTVDEGESWTRVDKLKYENEQVAIWGFELGKDNRLMIVGGASAREGTLGLFATKEKSQGWNVHEVNNIHLADAIFLSDSEVLACGSMLVEFKPPQLEVREAVLLYSPDKGKTWSVLSRYPQSTFLTALAMTDQNDVLAVGFEGLVLKIKLPLDRIPVVKESATATAARLQSSISELHPNKSAENSGATIDYEVGRVIRNSNPPHQVTVIISIDPQHFNAADLRKLASRLKNDFPDAPILRVETLDDPEIADNYVPAGEMLTLFYEHRRAFYSLDRKTGIEFMKFSSKRGKPLSQRINLSKRS